MLLGDGVVLGVEVVPSVGVVPRVEVALGVRVILVVGVPLVGGVVLVVGVGLVLVVGRALFLGVGLVRVHRFMGFPVLRVREVLAPRVSWTLGEDLDWGVLMGSRVLPIHVGTLIFIRCAGSRSGQ